MSDTKNILETFLENHNNHAVLLNDEWGNPLVVLADSNKELLDLEKFAPTPSHTRENKVFNDLRGFIDYVNDFKDDNTICFAGKEGILVYFDYHTKDQPSWCRHTATFKIEKSARWKIWEAAHNQWMPQRKFADFLDSGLNEIINPSQATILEMVKNFRATESYEFDSEATPYGGENLTFRKTTKTGTSTKSEVQIPEYVKLGLVPFENLTVINSRLSEENKIPAFELTAKINWHADFSGNGTSGLGFKVQILNVENVVNQTLEIIKNAVIELTQVKVYIA